MARHKVIHELTKSRRDQLVVDLATGATNYHRVSKELGISDSSIRRWYVTVPEDERLLLVAQAKQRSEVAAKRDAAGILMSDGDDIDNDLRWLLKRLKTAIDACEDDDKLLELAQMREMRNTLMDLAKVRGMFNQKIDVQIDLGSSPQFLLLRQIILRVLESHPAAKADFLTEMQSLKVIEHVGD
ncbi:MAG: hypothetical protein AAGK02_06660 [Pseudomonadota bacterium]